MKAVVPLHRTFADLSVGARESVEFCVSADDMRAFAALSGDDNPLHSDAAFAARKGFDGVVVYGALLVAKISQLIGMKLPGREGVWLSLSIKFAQPLLVGQVARVEGEVTALSEAARLVTLALAVRAGDRVLAKGKAEVLLATG